VTAPKKSRRQCRRRRDSVNKELSVGIHAYNITNHSQIRPMDPLPKPTRRRKWLRWLALPAAAVILALAYYLTRPPELVWWRSPLPGNTALRVKFRYPSSWLVQKSSPKQPAEDAQFAAEFVVAPDYALPEVIRWFWPDPPDKDSLQVY